MTHSPGFFTLDPADGARTARQLTEAAARASARWIGASEKEAADRAAVDALREQFPTCGVCGTVVIGEGEKDDAPHLVPGAQIGEQGPAVDVAVDPLEGTDLVAEDAPGALSVLVLAPDNAIRPLGGAFYAEKLIGPPAAQHVLDLDAPPERVVTDVAGAIGVPPPTVRVAVQKRPRHAGLIDGLRSAGATVHLFDEGDLSYALLALQPRDADGVAARIDDRAAEGPIDLLWGIGGAPEGILAAAAQRVVGGALRFRVAPRSVAERRRLHTDPALSPAVLNRPFSAAELVRSETVSMALTGVTDGPVVDGLRPSDDGLCTETLVLAANPSVRRVERVRSPDRPIGNGGE